MTRRSSILVSCQLCTLPRVDRSRRTTLLGSDSVDGIVRVTLSPDLAADGNGGSLALDGLTLGIDVGDLELD